MCVLSDISPSICVLTGNENLSRDWSIQNEVEQSQMEWSLKEVATKPDIPPAEMGSHHLANFGQVLQGRKVWLSLRSQKWIDWLLERAHWRERTQRINAPRLRFKSFAREAFPVWNCKVFGPKTECDDSKHFWRERKNSAIEAQAWSPLILFFKGCFVCTFHFLRLTRIEQRKLRKPDMGYTKMAFRITDAYNQRKKAYEKSKHEEEAKDDWERLLL